MKLSELNSENVGAVCRLFRQNVLEMTQSEFGEKHHISYAAISYFERGISVSLVTFLAYVHDGLDSYLPDVSNNAVITVVEYNKTCKKDYTKLKLSDLGKNY